MRSTAKRKANFNALTYGTNPHNPFEGEVQARPTSQYAGGRDG